MLLSPNRSKILNIREETSVPGILTIISIKISPTKAGISWPLFMAAINTSRTMVQNPIFRGIGLRDFLLFFANYPYRLTFVLLNLNNEVISSSPIFSIFRFEGRNFEFLQRGMKSSEILTKWVY